MKKIITLFLILVSLKMSAQSFSDFKQYKKLQFEQSIKTDTSVKLYVFELQDCHVQKRNYEMTKDSIYFQLKHTYYSIYVPGYNIGIFAESNREINTSFLSTIDKIRNQLFKYD